MKQDKTTFRKKKLIQKKTLLILRKDQKGNRILKSFENKDVE